MKMKRPQEKKFSTTKKLNKPSKQQNTNFSQQQNTSFMQKISEKMAVFKDKAGVTGKKIYQSFRQTSKQTYQNIKEIKANRSLNFKLPKYFRLDTSDRQPLSMLRNNWILASCVVLVLTLGSGYAYQEKQAQIHQELLEASKVYKVFVDGTYIGMVSETNVVEQYVQQELQEKKAESPLEVRVGNTITYDEYYEIGNQPQDQQVLQKLDEILDVQTKSVMVYVNETPVVRVADEQQAEQVIENVKDTYVTHSDKATVMMAEINERVDYQVEWAESDSIKDLESATAILLKGTDKEIKHVVENGENIWVIAQKNKVTVSEIMHANPQLKSEEDIIHPGDQLSLVVPEPFVNVEVVEEITEIEEVPFETKNVNNNKMYTWESKVKTPGQSGQREVVYRIAKVNGQEVSREILKEKELKKPVDQVVEKGTLGVPANGSGKLIWPTSGGKITSPYGGARRHSGVDIGNPTGTPIYAADDGTVVFAGWYGGYGNLVRVVHTSTMQTYYAHMSSINVKAGQAVKKGEVLGAVGSTGNSTGPHLHFEVRINGGTVNPLNYFSSR